MSTKKERLEAICGIIRNGAISNQDELLKELTVTGFSITQATLSRDIKYLQIGKTHDGNNNYIYTLPDHPLTMQNPPEATLTKIMMSESVRIEFSGSLAVIKTRPGYAMAIASDIDAKAPHEILGTIAGDDTILLIPREGISREGIVKALSPFIP